MPRAPVAVLGLLLLASCFGEEKPPPGCSPVSPSECPAFLERPWRVEIAAAGLRLPVGESQKKFLTHQLPDVCSNLVTSVAWSVDDPSMVGLTDLGLTAAGGTTLHPRVWVTGLRPGQTTLRAQITFTDGAKRDAEPGIVRVEAVEEPTGRLVAEGTVADLTERLIPVALSRTGRVEVTVDWTSFQSSVTFWLYEGECAATPCAGRAVAAHQVSSANVKPLRVVADNAPAGPYTLRLRHSEGPTNTVRYEVRLTPQ
jgi:hypothetical protein